MPGHLRAPGLFSRRSISLEGISAEAALEMLNALYSANSDLIVGLRPHIFVWQTLLRSQPEMQYIRFLEPLSRS